MAVREGRIVSEGRTEESTDIAEHVRQLRYQHQSFAIRASAPYALSFFGSGFVFATRTLGFNKTQGAFRLGGALQLAPRSLYFL